MPAWFWPPFEICINLVEIGVTVYFAYGLFYRGQVIEHALWKTLAVAVPGLVWLSAYIFFELPYFTDTLPCLLVFAIVSIWLLKTHWYEGVIWGLINTIITGITAFSVMSVLSMLQGVTFEALITYDNVRLLPVIITQIIRTVVVVNLVKIITRRPTYKFLRKWRLLFAVIPVFSIFLLILLMLSALQLEGDSVITVLSVLAGLGLLALNIGGLIVYDQMSRQAEATIELQAQMKTEREQVRLQKEWGTLYQDMRRFRHDFNGHAHAMLGLIQMAEYKKLSDYLQNLTDVVEALTNIVQTGNTAVDALLSSKIATARVKGIETRIDADIPSDSRISDDKLCVLVSNLFNNAYEACLGLPEDANRYIAMQIYPRKNNLYIYSENPTDGREIKRDGRWLTTKTDEGNHGLGLGSIDRVVKDYGGFCEHQHEQQVFRTTILLPLTLLDKNTKAAEAESGNGIAL